MGEDFKTTTTGRDGIQQNKRSNYYPDSFPEQLLLIGIISMIMEVVVVVVVVEV